MTASTDSGSQWLRWMANPWALGQAAYAYSVDAWQRALIYSDIERQVGDQYREQAELDTPNVLNFPSREVLSGLTLPRPVNYSLSRILPEDSTPTDACKRPFVVADPRAGHGPGIGGFKSESEIGAALNAGHPCYFVGFTPDPVPGQTVEDVMRAQAAFVRHVAELHPESAGKPAVIGNCQAGWQILMAAAVWPDAFGPIIVAGTPLSYWAGNNPMRYAGGLLGGSWLTALTSDLGLGRFDGANLVQNFENLDPANTLWAKQYKVYAEADTEAERYIGFEKYWGGYVFLNDVEIQYMVDNLFIGNKLSTAQLVTSDGMRIDLRNIRSPILVFSSYGDNITPPAQALGWITDLYVDDDDVRSHDQTIIYSTHDSIGHLGIFVSASVGSKEHRKFANVIDQIDLLPAGIYRASVDAASDDRRLVNDPYLLSIQRSSVDELREIVQPDPDSERRFAAAARISEINLALYRSTWQPWVRAFSTSQSARWLRTLHPMRLGFELWSSKQPAASSVRYAAEVAKRLRQPVGQDNPFLQLQQQFSNAIENALDRYRDRRDGIYAMWFEMLFGSPVMQALAGYFPGDTTSARQHPGTSPEHVAFVQQMTQQIESKLYVGGLLEAVLRGLFYVLQHRTQFDERYYHVAQRLGEEHGFREREITAYRTPIREQALVLRYHGLKAIDAIPTLLSGVDIEQIRIGASAISKLANVEKGSGAAETALKYVLELFDRAVADGTATQATQKVSSTVAHRATKKSPSVPAVRKHANVDASSTKQAASVNRSSKAQLSAKPAARTQLRATPRGRRP